MRTWTLVKEGFVAGENIWRWSDVEEDEVFDGIARQRITGDSFNLVRYTYAPGSLFPEHSHPEEQLTVVHSGEIEFTVGGETLVLRGGMLAIIPAGVPHGARVLGAEPVVSDNYIAEANRTPLQFSTDDDF
jgi:quercetin dioxygenase-like cupin family protein